MLSREDTAVVLAKAHMEVDPSIRIVYRIRVGDEREGDFATTIHLLEVTEMTPEAGIVPVGFGPRKQDGLLYPSVVVQITPSELERIQAGSLALPGEWRLDDQPLRPGN